MPGKKVNQRAIDFAAAINSDAAAFVELAVRRMSQPFDEGELSKLGNAGFEKTDGDYSVHKEGVTVTKVELDAETTVFVELGGKDRMKAYHSLEPLTRPAHVIAFLAELENDGSGKWMRGELMYRGHNLFEIYTSKAFNDKIVEVIKNDEELRDCKKCDKCKQMFMASANDEACRKMVQLLEKCAEENRIPPEKITCQEVYLGYNAARDTFVTGWDVWGSDSTGSVLLEFRINEDGEPMHESSNQEYDRHREIEEICDASNLKFYEKPKEGSRGNRSFYENISSGRNENWQLFDIRLD